MANTYTTLRGYIISTNETGTHCYMWPEGRKGERVRIKKAEYERIIREDELERKLVAEQEAAVEIEITELEPHEGEMVYHDEPIERIDIEAAVEATEESSTTEEIKEIAKEMAPKKKRTRKSKDIAFTVTVDGVEITLTAKQVDFIHHLPDTCFWERGLDSTLWTDVLADEIGGQFAGKPMTVGAMISTICEKGLGIRTKEKVNNRTATYFELTPAGKVVAAKLGLN